MELQVRNYILYKARTFEKRRKELEGLKKCYEEMKRDIIDESRGNFDGMPHGKGTTSDPVLSNVLRFEQLDRRIKTLEKELDIFRKYDEKTRIMGSLTHRIYRETILNQSNLEYKAMEYCMCPKTLYNYRSKLIEMIAADLGEYVDVDSLRK